MTRRGLTPVEETRPLRRLRWLGIVVVSAIVLGSLGFWVRTRATETRRQAIRSAIDRKHWSDAESMLVDWLKRNPDDGQAWLNLGSVRGILRREEDARDAFRSVRPGDPSWVPAQTLLGELALKHGDADEAERAFRGVAGRDPKATLPRTKLAFLLIVERRTDEARGVLWELYGLTHDPRLLASLTGLALEDGPQQHQFRDLGGERDRLKGELERFLRRAPEDPWLRRARGMIQYQLGRPAEARADLEHTAAVVEDDPLGRLALAECRIAMNDLEGIEEALGRPPGRPADLGRWWLLQGQVDQARSRLDVAIDSLRKAVAADPENRAAHYQLGQALIRRGQSAEAAPHLDRAEAIRLRNDDLRRAVNAQLAGTRGAEAFEALGRLCVASGMPAEGRAWYKQAVRLDPTRRGAVDALAALGKEASAPMLVFPRLRPTRDAPRMAGSRPSPPSATPRFVDEAQRRGLVYRYDCGERGNLYIGDTMGGGVGLLDFDDDGWLDVYFVNGCRFPIDPRHPPAPNKLFRNNGDGTFADVTGRAGVGGRGYGMGCAVGDYDNDGRDDLFVTGLGSTVLYRNDGDGRFTDVTERAGVSSSRWCTAAGFGDLDGDADLDLVVVTYVDADPNDVPPCKETSGRPIHCPPGRFASWHDHLFRNNGDGTFTDVGREAGLEVPDGAGLGLAVADLDQDGRLDLFVANDAVPDFLFRNLGGLRFEEVGKLAGAAFDGNGRATASMGVVADDLDGDGLIDLFHTNFYNEGSTLLHNAGDGLFTDTTPRSGIDAPSRSVTGFGAAALDADNDGSLDLFAANGHVDDLPAINQPMAQLPHWYTGRGEGRFEYAAASSAGDYFAKPVVGRGVAAGDLDNDGRVDLVVVHRDGPAALLRNTSAGGHWLGVRLRGSASGRTAIGARVTCRAGGKAITRWLTSGTSYLSSHDPRLWFGLGTATSVDQLEVRWPSGATQLRSDVPADQVLELREGEDPPSGGRQPL